MPVFEELVIETYIKEHEAKKWGLALTMFLFFFCIGLAIWPLIIIAFIVPFFVISKPSIEKYIALECPKCEKETIAVIPFKERYKAGKDFDFTKANNFDFQCQNCNAHMNYLNGYAIYKKLA